MSDDYHSQAGDIVRTHFDPSLGREQTGRRPALILSTLELSLNTGFAILAPITSRIRPFPTSIVLPINATLHGEILLNQIRSIDLMARPVRFVGRIDETTAQAVREKLDLLISI